MRKRINKRIDPQQITIFRLWHFLFFILAIYIYNFWLLIKNSPSKVEFGYSRTIYPFIAQGISKPASLLPGPYSISELVVGLGCLVFLIYTILLLVRAYRTNQFAHGCARIIIDFSAFLLGAYFLFLSFWGFNYIRDPFSVSYSISQPAYPDEEDYEATIMDMIGILNASYGHKPQSLSLEETWRIDKEVNASLKRVMQGVSMVFIPEPPPTKQFIFNEWMEAFGVKGVFIPFFMEPHINSTLLTWERPMTIAHEKAHFMGFASERDATLIAYITCMESDSNLLRYSAAMEAMFDLMEGLPKTYWYEQVLPNLSGQVYQDIQEYLKRIHKKANKYKKIKKISRKANDLMLKANSQKRGVLSYGDATGYFVSWWKSRKLSASP